MANRGPTFALGPSEYLHHEIHVKLGRIFGDQNQSRARKQAVSASTRLIRPRPRSPFWLRLVRVRRHFARTRNIGAWRRQEQE